MRKLVPVEFELYCQYHRSMLMLMKLFVFEDTVYCFQGIGSKLNTAGMNPSTEKYLLTHRFGTVVLTAQQQIAYTFSNFPHSSLKEIMDTSPTLQDSSPTVWSFRHTGHFAYWSFHLQDTSPTGLFAYETFCLLDSSPTVWTFGLQDQIYQGAILTSQKLFLFPTESRKP